MLINKNTVKKEIMGILFVVFGIYTRKYPRNAVTEFAKVVRQGYYGLEKIIMLMKVHLILPLSIPFHSIAFWRFSKSSQIGTIKRGIIMKAAFLASGGGGDSGFDFCTGSH